MQEIFTILQLAIYLRVNPITIRRYIQAGKIQAFKIGNDYRITRESLEKFIEEGTTKNVDALV